METLELVINAFIQENGGNNRLVDKIESEWCKSSTPVVNKWSEADVKFLLSNFNTMTVERMSNRLNRTYNATRKKIAQLREKAISDYRKSKNNSLH